ncbi:MAG: hypothetical protein WCA21_06685 [Terracidiphilus sp.]
MQHTRDHGSARFSEDCLYGDERRCHRTTSDALAPREAGGCCEHRFQELLDQALSAAKSFKPFSSAELASLLERTRSAA